MEEIRRTFETYPIDAGGVVQLLTGIREQSIAILIEYRIRESVDREKLRAATEKALDIFATFKVGLALAGPEQRPVYQANSDAVEVYLYDGKPHAFGRESNGYLFRVYHTENRVLLPMLHTLTDFCGANGFLKCILCQ